MTTDMLTVVLGSGALTAFITGIFGVINSNKKTRNAIVDKLDIVEKKIEKNTADIDALKLKTTADIDALKYENIKGQILDFSNALMNGKTYHQEQYSHILAVITTYEDTYSTKHNGELKQSIKFIQSAHTDYMRKKRQTKIKENTK